MDSLPTSQALIHTALLARIEFLESENAILKETPKAKQYFRIEDIQDDDKKVSFYTGFVSYMVFNSVPWTSCEQPQLLGIKGTS